MRKSTFPRVAFWVAMLRRIAVCRTISRGATFLLVATLVACSVDSTGPSAPLEPAGSDRALASLGERSIVVGWDEAMMVAVRSGRLPPTAVARALAIVHTAMYDAWAAYDAKAVGTRYGGLLRRPLAERTESNKRAAVSFAAYRTLVDLFPSSAEAFAARMAMLGYDPADVSTDRTTPAGIGNVAAEAVLTARHQDGSNQLGDLNPGPYSDYTGYLPVNTATTVNYPLRWQPLTVNGTVQRFATPHWNRVTPFALRDASQFSAQQGEVSESSKAMREAIDEVLEYSRDLDDRTKAIAEYWADGPSPNCRPGIGAFSPQGYPNAITTPG